MGHKCRLSQTRPHSIETRHSIVKDARRSWVHSVGHKKIEIVPDVVARGVDGIAVVDPDQRARFDFRRREQSVSAPWNHRGGDPNDRHREFFEKKIEPNLMSFSPRLSRNGAYLVRQHGIEVKLLQRGVYCITLQDVLNYLDQQKPTRSLTMRHAPLFIPRSGKVRRYQWECVKHMREESGFVIAPCGCGKTLIGLLAAVLNGGRFMVLTSRYPEQWKTVLDEFFCPIDAAVTVVVNSTPPPGIMPDVFISTYSAFCPTNERLRLMKHLVYDTVVLDEAHCAASSANLAMIDRLHAVRWCALTATLVREDKELTKLEERIGPVVAEVDRSRLVREGFIPDVNITNIVVPYDNVAQLESHIGRQNALALHPNKIQALLQVIRVLLAESHKIIVFCDDLFCLRWTSGIVKSSGVPLVGTISMATPMDERTSIIKSFEDSTDGTVLFVSRTGDEALDVPSASAGIVFWNNWASRRQIVQRIGRLSRMHDKKHPVFLTLLADDSKEHEASKHRETYMRQHGFVVHTEAWAASRYNTPLRTGETYIARLKSLYRRECVAKN